MKDTPDGTIPVTAHMKAVDSMAKLHKSVVANLHADLDKYEKEKAELAVCIKEMENGSNGTIDIDYIRIWQEKEKQDG